MSERAVNSDTPFSKGIANGHHTHSLGTAEEGRQDLQQYRAQLADDMAHAAILTDREKFCNAYFPTPGNPTPNKPRPVLDENPFAKLGQLEKFAGNEKAICDAFIEAVNTHNLIPGFVMRKCGNRPDGLDMDPAQQKVDAAWYFEHEAKGTGKQEWGDQAIPVEFKGDEVREDPFDDEKDNISTKTKSRKKARGQMITYAEILHAIQQRTAVFMLVIIGRRARFTRWDRSGTVVTRAFNYVDDWRFMCDILWRIGYCSKTQLGFDPTATRLSKTDPDWQRMVAATSEEREYVNHSERQLEGKELPKGEFQYVRDMFSESLVDDWPRYRVEVPVEVPVEVSDGNESGAEKKLRYFLIAKPTFCAKGMAGRGTRGYVALDCETGKFVWLKDAWRANYEFVRKEGDILAELNAANVSNVPTMVCHGDIEGQTTETPNWWALREKRRVSRSAPASDGTRSSITYVNPSSSRGMKRKLDDDDEASAKPATETEGCPLRLHQHYRLIVQEVAMPLDRFEYPQQLVQVIFDCVLAHYEASTKPKEPLLHRDISSGNILIYPRVIVNKSGDACLQWKGILADWEMSKPLHRGDELRQPRQPERTGTWQYTSVMLLSPGDKLIALSDELESFFHVFLYYAVRYIKSVNCEGHAIAHFLDTYFDVYGQEDGMYICGAVKTSTIKRGTITVGTQTLYFGNPLDGLFNTMLSWFSARYLIADYEKNSPASTTQKAVPTDPSELRRRLFQQNDTTSDILAQFGPPEPVPQPKKKEGPSEEDKALAEVLDSHKGLALALGQALRDTWPDEKAEDQIPETWKPSKKFPHPPSRNVENKRRRINKAKHKVARSEPLPLLAARPPKTPPPRRAVRSLQVVEDEDGDTGSGSGSSSDETTDEGSDYVYESEPE